MEIARFRRLCRAAFFFGAMLIFFGIGLYLMDLDVPGIALMIVGIAASMICFSITKTFALYDFQHRRSKK